MPSPLGHALAGAAVGWALAGPAGGPGQQTLRHLWHHGGLFALLAIAPDTDLLLFAVHRGPSHSLTAAAVVGLAVATLAGKRLGLAAGAAYASHVGLDWLGTDTSPPIGLMALWPFTREYYESSLHLFHAISRRYWSPQFWEQNLRAVGWELLILLPPAGLVLWLRLSERQPFASRRAGKGESGRS